MKIPGLFWFLPHLIYQRLHSMGFLAHPPKNTVEFFKLAEY